MQNLTAKVLCDSIFENEDSTVLKEVGVNILATDLGYRIDVFAKGIFIEVSGFDLFR